MLKTRIWLHNSLARNTPKYPSVFLNNNATFKELNFNL